MLIPLLLRFQFFCPFIDQQQGKQTEESERTVYQLPENRYGANGAANKRQRENQNTAYYPKLRYPNVFDGVAERSDKRNRNNNVRKCQPVRTVAHKRKLGGVVIQPFLNVPKINRDVWKLIPKRRPASKILVEQMEFASERKSRNPAQNQSKHKKRQRDANFQHDTNIFFLLPALPYLNIYPQ